MVESNVGLISVTRAVIPQLRMLHVPNNSDDPVRTVAGKRYCLTYGVFVWKIRLRQGGVDYNDQRGTDGVPLIHVTTPKQRDSHHSEVIWSRCVPFQPRRLRYGFGLPRIDPEGEAVVLTTQRNQCGEARRLHAGNLANSLDQLLEGNTGPGACLGH